MKRWRRRAPWAALLALSATTGWWWLTALATDSRPVATAAVAAALNDPARITHGEYLTRIGDCAGCHTVRGGKPYAGGRVLTTPFGDITAPNITSDAVTGLGKWSFANFWQALHEGKGHEGQLLYPVFSYTSFTKITRNDALDIFAYLRSLPAVHQPDAAPGLHFPYSIRSGLKLWRMLYFNPGVYEVDPSQSAEWNRGAYLVEGLGHCNECHTTRDRFGGFNRDQFLAGGTIPGQGWYAPSLSTRTGGGLEGWTREDIKQLLKTGQSAKGAVFGPMADVVRNSTQYLKDGDLEAIAVYLESLPAPATGSLSATMVTQAADYAVGREIYSHQCASCHGDAGEGIDGRYPALDGNTVALDPTGTNAIRSVLLGGFPPATQANPRPWSMPPYAHILSNEDVAAVANYIRQSWSNQAPAVTPEQVMQNRYAATE